MNDKLQSEEANRTRPVSLGGKSTFLYLIAILAVAILLFLLIRFTLLR